jgi:hypothetical protein
VAETSPIIAMGSLAWIDMRIELKSFDVVFGHNYPWWTTGDRDVIDVRATTEETVSA